MRKDLEDWLRGDARKEPLFSGGVAVLDNMGEDYLVVPLAPLFRTEEPFFHVKKPVDSLLYAEEDEPESVSSVERAKDMEDKKIEDKEIEDAEGVPTLEKNVLGEVRPEVFSAERAPQGNEGGQDENDGKSPSAPVGEIGGGSMDERDRQGIRYGDTAIDDGDRNKDLSPEMLAEQKATRFAERLRYIERTRRTSPARQRKGSRRSRGRILLLCIIVVLVGGTVFAVYRHLRRNSYGSLMEMAETFYSQEDYGQALDAYKQTFDRYPKRVEPLLGMANAAERAGRIEEAIAAYRSSLALFPADAAPARSGAFYEIGRLYSGLKAWNKAQESFEEAVVSDATNHAAYVALGSALEEQNKPKAAIGAYQRALDLSPSSDAAKEAIRRLLSSAPPENTVQDAAPDRKYEHALQVGSVALGLKKYAEASRYFSEALGIRSDDAKAWVGFADARANLGDTAGAIKSLRRALEREPDHGDAKSKLEKLEKNQKKPPSRPSRRSSPSAPQSRRKRSDSLGTSSAKRSTAGTLDSALSRGALFGVGVERYHRGEYAQAMTAFLDCLRSQKNDPLPSAPLAGDIGPSWKGFRGKLSIPSDARLLAEAVVLNPGDRDLYLNLFLSGIKMGADKKTLLATLNDIYAHALARR